MNRLGIMAGGLVMLGAALAGCSASVIQGGPLSTQIDPDSHDTQCIDMQRGDVVVDGFNTIPNSGRQVAVVDKVAFADPVRLRQIAAYIIPDNGELYGDLTGYPPTAAISRRPRVWIGAPGRVRPVPVSRPRRAGALPRAPTSSSWSWPSRLATRRLSRASMSGITSEASITACVLMSQ